MMKELQKLGKNKDEVAASLAKLGIKGIRGSVCGCPIARYIRHYLRDSIGHVYPSKSTRGGEVYTSRGKYKLPAACNEFAIAFDDRQYPELIDT